MIKRNILDDKYNVFLFCLLLIAFVIRSNSISERTFDLWDEGWYVSSAGSGIEAAKYVYNNFDEILNGNFNASELRLFIKQNSPGVFASSGKPSFSIILFIGLLIGGVSQSSVFYEMIIISIISSYLIYKIAKHLFDKRVGFLATLLSVISGIMIIFSRVVMPQMVMVMWCLLAFYSCLKIHEKNWSIIFGVSSSFAFFTHPACGLILISLWIYCLVSIYNEKNYLDKKIISKIIISSIIPAFLFILISYLPGFLFSHQINNPDYYLENILRRGVTKGIDSGIFYSINQVPFLLSNIWESESISILFSIFGILLIIKNKNLDQNMIILIPLCYTLIYFIMGISYRFRMFILIYPYLYILSAVGLVYLYDNYLKNRFNKFSKIVLIVFISPGLYNYYNLEKVSNNTNNKNYEILCSKVESYLLALPPNEKREISMSQGFLSTWLNYYFSKRRLDNKYPTISRSMIWDWVKERPNKQTYGDMLFVINVGDSLLSHNNMINYNSFNPPINEMTPIIQIPYNIAEREAYKVETIYFHTPFKRKNVTVDVYDLISYNK